MAKDWRKIDRINTQRLIDNLSLPYLKQLATIGCAIRERELARFSHTRDLFDDYTGPIQFAKPYFAKLAISTYQVVDRELKDKQFKEKQEKTKKGLDFQVEEEQRTEWLEQGGIDPQTAPYISPKNPRFEEPTPERA